MSPQSASMCTLLLLQIGPFIILQQLQPMLAATEAALAAGVPPQRMPVTDPSQGMTAVEAARAAAKLPKPPPPPPEKPKRSPVDPVSRRPSSPHADAATPYPTTSLDRPTNMSGVHSASSCWLDQAGSRSHRIDCRAQGIDNDPGVHPALQPRRRRGRPRTKGLPDLQPGQVMTLDEALRVGTRPPLGTCTSLDVCSATASRPRTMRLGSPCAQHSCARL